MTIEFNEDLVVLSETVGVEEAETLLGYLQAKPHAKVDLATCTHLHTANIQVLVAAGSFVINWPTNADLTLWLQSVLRH